MRNPDDHGDKFNIGP